VGKDLLHYARDRIFVLLREANHSRSKECKGKSAFHGNASRSVPLKDKPAKPNSPPRDTEDFQFSIADCQLKTVIDAHFN